MTYSAKILHILCEGQTEERFVKDVLAPYLLADGIVPKPILLCTSKKKNANGGMLSYAQAKRDLGNLMKQYRNNSSEQHWFTTMFDYYALPTDFPGMNGKSLSDARQTVGNIESQFEADISSKCFIPYVQLHEFEALLFTDIEKLILDYPESAAAISKLKEDTDKYRDPEMINNSPNTAPSKRIIKALSPDYNYNKPKSGAKIAGLIGIEAIMAQCQHFREWICKIKNIE